MVLTGEYWPGGVVGVRDEISDSEVTGDKLRDEYVRLLGSVGGLKDPTGDTTGDTTCPVTMDGRVTAGMIVLTRPPVPGMLGANPVSGPPIMAPSEMTNCNLPAVGMAVVAGAALRVGAGKETAGGIVGTTLTPVGGGKAVGGGIKLGG